MKIGICAAPAEVAALANPPFDFVEANVQNLLVPEQPDETFAPLAEAARRAVRPVSSANCFLPGNLKVTGPAVDYHRLTRYAETAFARAAAVGLRMIAFGSGGARQVPEGWSQAIGFEQFVEALRRIAPLAQRHGVVVVVEPLNHGECNLVNTVLEGAVAVARAGHPNIRLLVDLFHLLRNDESPDEIVKASPFIAHAHLAEQAVRSEPGARGEDFRPFLRALKQTGYTGAIAIECNWSGPMPERVGPAVADLRRQLADVGY